MNISTCISSIIGQYGLNNITLPFKNVNGEPVPIENIIYEILSTTTIPIYSDYVPHIKECTMNPMNMKMIDKTQGIYELPPILTSTPIKYIFDVSPAFNNTRGTFGDIAPAFGINRSAQGVIVSQAYQMLSGQMRAEPTFKDLGGNRVQLFGFSNIPQTFKVACQHALNGETIEESCRTSFMQLATLDVKVYLYNNLKLYDNMTSAFGNTSLKSEDFAGADSERTQLLAQWDDSYHLDFIDNIEWM